MRINPDLVIPNKNLSINQGAILASGWSNADSGTIAQMYYSALAEEYGFSLDTPIKDLSEEQLNVLLYGTNGKKIKMTRVNAYGSGTYLTEFEGVINNLQRRYNETTSEYSRAEITKVMDECNCPECNGKGSTNRLLRLQSAVRILLNLPSFQSARQLNL